PGTATSSPSSGSAPADAYFSAGGGRDCGPAPLDNRPPVTSRSPGPLPGQPECKSPPIVPNNQPLPPVTNPLPGGNENRLPPPVPTDPPLPTVPNPLPGPV